METRQNLLLITYSPDIINGEPLYFSSNSLPLKAPNFEPAGHSFHAAALKLCGIDEQEDAEADDRSVSSDDRSQYYKTSGSYSSKGKKKSADGSQQQDHYALLGLGHLRFLATEVQIRKSFRDMALKHHPDKQAIRKSNRDMALKHHPDKQAALILAEETVEEKQAKEDEIDFKAVQEAYEVLMDPVKRRIYDSTDEFDDDIPTDCAPQDFFKVFSPAFMRNGRWSVNQPVPSLGDDDTPIDAVDSFYNFWYSFNSWREFPHADEFDLEQAESREDKRWMERQNAKLQEKAKKTEYARVRALVHNAYKKDPRILRRKEDEKAEKQRRKEAKYLAKRLQEEETARAAEEEKQRKEEAAKKAAEAALNQKKLKEKEKKLLRKEKSRLRTLAATITKSQCGLSEDDVEKACTSLDMEQLKKLCDSLEDQDGDERARSLRIALDKDSPGATRQEKNIQESGSKDSLPSTSSTVPPVTKDTPVKSSEKKEKPWGKEEIELLRKAMRKYPTGTSQRWEVISEYLGTGRSVDDLYKATKTVLLQKPDSAKAFDSFLEKRKPAQAIVSPLSTRMEVDAPSTEVNGIASSKMVAETVDMSSSAANQTTAADPIPNGISSATDQDTWTEADELLLVKALKTIPKDASQRWERIATAIPGKTVVQCKKKFAMIKENFRSKK